MRLRTDEQQWRVEQSVKEWTRLNFATVTMAEEEQDPKVITKRWTALIKLLRRNHYPALKCVRVLQKHEKGHGWHIHALMDRYIPKRLFDACAEQCGLGFTWLKMVSGAKRQECIAYVVRYIVRDMRDRWRDKALKGVRLLTASGHLRSRKRWWLRLCDLVIEDTGNNARSLLERLAAMHGIVAKTKRGRGSPPVRLVDLLRVVPDGLRELWMRTCREEPSKYGWVY